MMKEPFWNIMERLSDLKENFGDFEITVFFRLFDAVSLAKFNAVLEYQSEN